MPDPGIEPLRDDPVRMPVRGELRQPNECPECQMPVDQQPDSYAGGQTEDTEDNQGVARPELFRQEGLAGPVHDGHPERHDRPDDAVGPPGAELAPEADEGMDDQPEEE